MQKKIGQIGLGWIGKNYANSFERRGFEVVRYSKSECAENRELIKDCDIVFIAVPTPTTPQGFDFSIVDEVLSLIGKNKIAVIKSTILPGTTDELQKRHPDVYLMHSPEFLTEATAEFDANNPDRNIIGYTEKSKCKAAEVMSVLPTAPYEAIIPCKEAELIKYAGNCWFYLKVVYVNMLYDLAQSLGLNYETIKDGMAADKRIGRTHLDPIHKSGRGAGGHCFIKDMAAFARIYEKNIPLDIKGLDLLDAIELKNIELLKQSKKDLNILGGVYAGFL
ncbi:MAG: hypothetical protein A3F67_11800 [Verrucomicrobia bacterium RIFCSPHIGHO2_12_FULL_41_10]|nr:MAG: hypothetical protein A3F67_11800 [Verrucomicrobia bacterium RIFCSPHIGHO2_12_FULL_41_10]HLB57390.1 hypothetical protein [Gammaproteobacteria bacterium]